MIRRRDRGSWGASAVMAVSLMLAGPPVGRATEPSAGELIPEHAAIAAGKPLWVALRITLDDGWHTYWRNPGDAGAPTTIAWDLPDGLAAGPIVWPAPKRYGTGSRVSFGYADEVWLLTRIDAAADLAPGQTVRIAAEAEWLACADICIPQFGTYTMDLPVAESRVAGDGHGGFADARARLPEAVASPATFEMSSEIIDVAIPLSRPPGQPSDAWLFPVADGIIDYAATPTARIDGDTLHLTVRRHASAIAAPRALTGVVTFTDGGAPRALAFEAKSPDPAN